jgi:hypothetical protein
MKRIIIVAVIFLLAVSSRCLADFNISKWKYYKDISSIDGGLAKIMLDDEIFSNAAKDLSDLRVIDGDNKEVPFKIVSGYEKSQKDQVPVKMINNSFISGKFSQVILDLGNSGNITNNLTINTNSENFQRNVRVYGGNDIETRSVLRDNGYIYDFTDRKGNFKSQNTEISFPDSAYRYIKIEIADENGNPVRINSVTTSRVTKEKNQEYERHPQMEIREDAGKKITALTVDLGASGIPTDKIAIISRNSNFNRAVSIYSSNEKGENSWAYLGQGYIFRYNTPKFTGENMAVDFPETNKRFIKIEISNKDDSPLGISGLSTFSVYREIMFQTDASKNFRLFYGNQKADYPQYDLEKYFQYLEPDKAVLVKMTNQKNNPGYIPEKEPEKPLSERIPYLLSVILALASLILIFLVYKFLKK